MSVPVVYSGDCTNVSSANGCTATATYGGDAGTWAPWYTQHKIMRGLLDEGLETGGELAAAGPAGQQGDLHPQWLAAGRPVIRIPACAL